MAVRDTNVHSTPIDGKHLSQKRHAKKPLDVERLREFRGTLKIWKLLYAKGGGRPKSLVYGRSNFCISTPVSMRVCGARSRRVFGHPQFGQSSQRRSNVPVGTFAGIEAL